MALKRMFSLQVVDTDHFLDLPISAQALYFHLGMHGDDDGFVSSPKKIIRTIGAADADLSELINNGFIIQFDSGIVVITDWKINNTLKNDRYKETIFSKEKGSLTIDGTGRYLLQNEAKHPSFQNGTNLETDRNHNIDKQSLEENNLTEINKGEERGCGGKPHNQPPADFEELRRQGLAKLRERG